MYGQLPLFEGETPEVLRATITGSCDSLNNELPAMKLGASVVLVAKGSVTKVTHAHTGNGMERQHVVVLDGIEWLAVEYDALVAAALRIQSTIDQDDDSFEAARARVLRGEDEDEMTVSLNGGPEIPFSKLEEARFEEQLGRLSS